MAKNCKTFASIFVFFSLFVALNANNSVNPPLEVTAQIDKNAEIGTPQPAETAEITETDKNAEIGTSQPAETAEITETDKNVQIDLQEQASQPEQTSQTSLEIADIAANQASPEQNAPQASQPEQTSQTSLEIADIAANQASPEQNAPKYIDLDIPYPENILILKFHNEFNSDFGKKWLKGVLETAAPYRKYIRQKLEEYGLPKCLEYLPVIESNYNIKAVSKSGAVGLWQFMENSIAGYLTKTTWLDERKDPWLATDAALKKLKENYAYFNDWPLALAAYNMGLGGISRLLKSTSCKTYWELLEGGHLKKETANYVPKFIAISDLITNSEYYGLDLPQYDEEASLEFDEVLITKQIGLEQLSSATQISVKTYQNLNPALTYPVTPYTNKFYLRVPKGQKESIEETLSQMQPLSTDIYVVKKGDTLWGISRRYGISVESLCNANNIKESQILHIGTTLFVPIIQ